MFSEAKIIPKNPEVSESTPVEIPRDKGGRVRWKLPGNSPEENLDEEPVYSSDPILTFLRGDTKQDYKSFRRDLLRPLRRISGLNWQVAEELAKQILEERLKHGDSPRNRVVAYAWILKEAKLQQYRKARD